MKQEDLEDLLAAVDKSVHGAETGVLTKAEVRSALDSFFAVGQPGGKTLNRFDELMQVNPIARLIPVNFEKALSISTVGTWQFAGRSKAS